MNLLVRSFILKALGMVFQRLEAVFLLQQTILIGTSLRLNASLIPANLQEAFSDPLQQGKVPAIPKTLSNKPYCT